VRCCPLCGGALATDAWICAICGWAADESDGLPLLAAEAADPGGGFRPEGFAGLAAAEENSFWFQGRNKLIGWALASNFPSAQSFLEVGCGTGFVLQHIERTFPALRVTGCELFVDGLHEAARRVRRSELLQADARHLPFREEFDVVGTFDVLEHIAEDRAALASIRDALVPGGGLIVTVPQHPALWSPTDDYACHERRYTRDELRSKLETSGFTVDRMTSFVSLLLPAMVLSRVRSRGTAATYEPTAEHDAVARYGAALGHVLSLERGMIKAGISLPVGGSLLAVARRSGRG
jgi:SAM-dependent methyltransferase